MISLSNQTARLVEMLDRAANGVFMLDANGALVFANQHLRQWLQQSGMAYPEFNLLALFDLQIPKQPGPNWYAECHAQLPGNHRFRVMLSSCTEGEAPTCCGFLGLVVPCPDECDCQTVQVRDPLTGLPDESSLLAGITANSQSLQGDETLLLAYVDIDDFRQINSELGRELGDQVLIEIAQRLRCKARAGDMVARITGDRFAVLFNKTPRTVMENGLIQRLLDDLIVPMQLDNMQLELACSIGIAIWPDHGPDAMALLAHAGAARMMARNQGGRRWQVFQPEMGQIISGRTLLLQQMRQALTESQFVLYYQPQVSLHSGEIVGLEALVRWQHPSRGLVPPGQFIPQAEETGFIIPLGEWVLQEACRQTKIWHDEGAKSLRVAVNLSARQIRYSDICAVTEAALAQTGLPPRCLELELTETAMMQDIAASVRVVDRLKQMGVRLSLDDFGTGYSSLSYLSRFAIDMLKLDQSFVADITTNPANASIAIATIAMAHKLGKYVIAEGVETVGQMNYLRLHDCDEMQGFFFSKPMPAVEIGKILHEHRMQQFSPEVAGNKKTLLLVDDEPNILSSLRRLLRSEGYTILTANSAQEGLMLLAQEQVQVIVSDQRMPEMTGVEFLSRVKTLYPSTTRIILSGYSELNTITAAINEGAIYKYLTKPWDDDDFKALIRQAFRYHLAKAE